MTTKNKKHPFLEKYGTQLDYWCELAGTLHSLQDKAERGEDNVTEQDIKEAQEKFDLYQDSVGKELSLIHI